MKKGLNPRLRTKEELHLIRKDVYPASKFLHRKWIWFKEFWRPVRFSAYYFPFPDARFRGRWLLKHNLSSFLCYGILLPFMMIGFIFLIRKKNRIWIFLAFPIDAFIMIVAFYAVSQIYTAWKSRNEINRGKEFPLA